MKKTIVFWSVSIILTIIIAFYQRASGPTYPIKDSIKIGNTEINYKLTRSHGGPGNEDIKIYVPIQGAKALFSYKRYKSHDTLTTQMLESVNDTITASIPHQPPAGKVEYRISLITQNNKIYHLTQEPVIIRFRGDVPSLALIPHIILMFLAILLACRTAFEAYFKGEKIFLYTVLTTLTLFVGGLIIGPIVQLYAFGELWTGWPWGHDLTDNKTAFSFMVWMIALVVTSKNRNSGKWALIAFVLMMVIYFIPHSMLGSELDYTKMNP